MVLNRVWSVKYSVELSGYPRVVNVVSKFSKNVLGNAPRTLGC